MDRIAERHRLADLFSLSGRRAVVTGAAGGLGCAICRRLAEAGARVVAADLQSEAAIALARDLNATFGAGTAEPATVDVSDPDSVAGLRHRAVSNLSGIDIWINNAAIFPRRPVLEMTPDEWDRVIDINLKGAFLGAREAGLQMSSQGLRDFRYVILNIASLSGLGGRAYLGHYVASKHGLVGLTKSLAIELGPLGVRVLALAPGRLARPSASIEGRPADSDVIAKTPIGRLVTYDDIARSAVFFCSDLADAITGCTVPIDGGVSIL